MGKIDDHLPYTVSWERDAKRWQVMLAGPVGIPIETFSSKKRAVSRARELARNNTRPGVVVYDRKSMETSDLSDRSVFGNPHRFIPNEEYWLGQQWKMLKGMG